MTYAHLFWEKNRKSLWKHLRYLWQICTFNVRTPVGWVDNQPPTTGPSSRLLKSLSDQRVYYLKDTQIQKNGTIRPVVSRTDVLSHRWLPNTIRTGSQRTGELFQIPLVNYKTQNGQFPVQITESYSLVPLMTVTLMKSDQDEMNEAKWNDEDVTQCFLKYV